MFSKELFGKRIMELRKNHQEKQPILADLLGVSVAISARSSGATDHLSRAHRLAV